MLGKWEAPLVDWRSTSMASGGQCVLMASAQLTLKWLAGS